MSLEKVDALVVKSVDYSESSLILNVFTREMGKVRGIAKGARRLKNPFETSLDLLASIRLSFIRKNSDALDLFTEAKLRRRFRPTQRNFRGLYAGYYVAETLDFATQDYEPFPDLWTLADATLERLQEGGNVAARLAYYEAGLLKSAGEFPSVRACVNCGENLPLDQVTNLARRVYFDADSGGVICARCRAEGRFSLLTPTTIGALKLFDAALAGSEETLRIARTLETWRRALEEEVAGLSSIDRLEREAKTRDAFQALDATALAPFDAFPQTARDAYRKLANVYVPRVLRRRPRSLDYLPFALSDPKTFRPSGAAYQKDLSAAENESKAALQQ